MNRFVMIKCIKINTFVVNINSVWNLESWKVSENTFKNTFKNFIKLIWNTQFLWNIPQLGQSTSVLWINTYLVSNTNLTLLLIYTIIFFLITSSGLLNQHNAVFGIGFRASEYRGPKCTNHIFFRCILTRLIVMNKQIGDFNQIVCHRHL